MLPIGLLGWVEDPSGVPVLEKGLERLVGEGRVEVVLPAELVEQIAERVAMLVVEGIRDEVQPTSRWLTVPEAAVLLRAKPQRVYDLLSDGRLTRHKDGRRVLVDRRELDAYLDNRRGG